MKWKIRSGTALGFLFILPTVVVLGTTIVYPLVLIFLYSLREIGLGFGTKPSEFVGLENYWNVLTSENFADALVRSASVTAISVVLTISLAMVVAVLLNAKFRGRGIARSLLILPWAMPTFVAAFVWRWMLDYSYGAINHILVLANLTETPILFFSKNLALFTASLTYTWKGLPWAAMVLLAGLQVVPQELRDAARVDGTSVWKEWLHVELPSLRFVIQVAVVLLLIWNFNWFEMMWLLTQGGPGRATTILPIDVYLQAFQAFNVGHAAALSTIMLMILLTAAFVLFRLWAKGETGL